MLFEAAIGILLAALFKPFVEGIGEKVRDKLMPKKPPVGTAGSRRIRRAKESKQRHKRRKR